MHAHQAFLRRLLAAAVLAGLAGSAVGRAAEPGPTLALDAAVTSSDAVVPAEIGLGDPLEPRGVVADSGAGSILGGGEPPPEVFEMPVSAEGFTIEDMPALRMPYEASSGSWFGSGDYYGSAEVLFMSFSVSGST